MQKFFWLQFGHTSFRVLGVWADQKYALRPGRNWCWQLSRKEIARLANELTQALEQSTDDKVFLKIVAYGSTNQ